jgi:hypothetical protein
VLENVIVAEGFGDVAEFDVGRHGSGCQLSALSFQLSAWSCEL